MFLISVVANTKQEDEPRPSERHTIELHKLSRAWHAMLKDLADIKEHIASLRCFYNECQFTTPTNHEVQNESAQHKVLKQLDDTCQFWYRWVETYRDRTVICIDLV
jgi:hypothetical protein